ncbi:hypothetical protein G195_005255 [Phytophthora kernoviae 00238/432]|uniref:Mitochondrial carrier protein n=1 Tax=Phytophthora kernoviae 00238/432 TaxID=1284355 RepID=A0A8J4SI55_9STRA|nr:hypothetical protein G195_005255 [Phytophthora kernoviae 00238/432]
MSERAERLSGLQNGAVGSIAGMIEVMLQQPTVAMKNAVQQGRPIHWNVAALYRGVGVSLASIVPVSAIQFAANGRLLRGLTSPGQKPSDQVRVLCGTLSGVASAPLSASAELVMTLQQNNGKSFGATVKEVAQQHGAARLLRGFTATAVRDAVWCAGYLALGPVFTQKMHDLSPATFGHVDTATTSQKASASVVGCLAAGLVTVVATQPVDTIKTVMQGEAMTLPSGRAPSTLATAGRIYREGGLNGAVGSLAGMIEMTIQQPWVAVKNAVQQGRPIPRSVTALYRGLGVSLTSIAPVSAIRFAINGRLLRVVSGTDSAPSDQVKVLCSTLSGATAAAITGPAELVMTLQQNIGKSLGATVKEVVQTHGVTRLLRGYPATAVRDAVWCAGYLALGPLFTREVHRLRPQTFGEFETATTSQKASASVVGCLAAGLFVVPITQPVDTIKTVMQGEAMKLPSGPGPGILTTAKRMHREGGLPRFYRGIVARGSRLVGAVFILGQARMRLEEIFEEHDLLKAREAL